MDRGTLSPRFDYLGIPVYEASMPRGRPTLRSAWRTLTLVRQLKPDLIQGWMYHGNTAASLTRSFNRSTTPVIWNIRHTPYNLEDEARLTRLLITLGAKFSRRPEKIIYNSITSAVTHGLFEKERNLYSKY